MDESNPDLYRYLSSFVNSNNPGMKAFKAAQTGKKHGYTFSQNSPISDYQLPQYHSNEETYLQHIMELFRTSKVEGFGYNLLRRGALGQLRRNLRSSRNYLEWKSHALNLDQLMGKEAWKSDSAYPYYDWKLILKLNEKLSGSLKKRNADVLKDVLTQGCLKTNVGNIENIKLYSNTYYGSKNLVEDYYNKVIEGLNVIGEDTQLSLSDKKQFFKEAFRSYGRTALCLSGGAGLAYFHFGLIKTLLDNGLLPKIITGTSAGSMIASIVACRTDDELNEILNPDTHILIKACSGPFLTKVFRFLSTGALFDSVEFATNCQWVTLGHTTFLEAYQRTGKILNITAVPFDSYSPPKLLNYITAPNVVIWSAVIASSAVPGVINPVTLMTKRKDGTLEPYLADGLKWRDGSFKTDIPLEALNSCFNVKYTIVSQVNPHVSVFFYEHRGSVGRPSAHRHGKGWRGGFLASSAEHFLKLDLKKWLRVLRDLELLPHFVQMDWSYLWLQKFDGSVTILPKFSTSDYINILTDPDYDRLVECFKRGAMATYPKLHLIDNRTKIERKIFEWLDKLYHPSQTGDSDKHHDKPDLPPEAKMLPNGEPTSNGKNKSNLSQTISAMSPIIDSLSDPIVDLNYISE